MDLHIVYDPPLFLCDACNKDPRSIKCEHFINSLGVHVIGLVQQYVTVTIQKKNTQQSLAITILYELFGLRVWVCGWTGKMRSKPRLWCLWPSIYWIVMKGGRSMYYCLGTLLLHTWAPVFRVINKINTNENNHKYYLLKYWFQTSCIFKRHFNHHQAKNMF